MTTSFSADPIRALDDAVIAGIAAGEVVERPASIVKELVENALDAGARRVTVSYDDEDGGTPRISVTDDGRGIASDQLDLAVARHATSKIRVLDDLPGVATFGFRGEALSSIGAVSRMEIVSRTSVAPAGARIVVAHGRVEKREPAGARPGTRVSITELFASVPARRKFMKTPGAEYALAADVLRRFALARPDVHFRLERESRVAFEHAAVGDLGARLQQVYRSDVSAGMVRLDARYKGMHLGGAVSPAGVSWGSARRLWLFVNGRSVHDRLLFRAVMEAYRTYLLKGRYPAAALFLHVDTRRLDVNVHPQKLEVRFAEPDAVMAFVVEAIREALRAEASPLGRWGLEDAAPRAASQSRAGGQAEYAAHARAGERAHAAELQRRAPGEAPSAGHAQLDALPALVREDGGASYALPGYEPASAAAVAALVPSGRPAQQQHALFDAAGSALDDLEIVGQVFAGYVVCQRPGEMVLIDQHAAHERVLFERLMKSFRERAVERQGLVAPITANVGAEGVEAVARLKDALAAAGWDLEPFGEDDVIVRAVPAISADRDVAALVERVVRDMIGTSAALAAERVVEQIMATVACHSAVRVGKRLDTRGARALLDEIRTVDFASTCPHGRPVARILERARVEHLFGR